jgi:hypothetical protein
MFESLDYVMGLIEPEARVLDVGGWAEVFPRANAVLDVNPYATRKIVHPEVPEQFDEHSWFIGDICAAPAWRPFSDKEFDFSICSHTLEDVRDPLYVCSQLIRVSKAGYLEFPSPFRETCKIDPDDLSAGYSHHRWIVDVDERDRLVFVAKLAWANDFDPGGGRARRALRDPRFTFLSMTWSDSFSFYERMPKGTVLESENLFHFYETFNYGMVPSYRRVLAPGDPNLPTFLWVDSYQLPVEAVHSDEFLVKRYEERRSVGTPGGKWRRFRGL